MTNPETPSTALKRLIELEDAASTNGADPDTTVWDDAVAAGRAALKAEPEGPSLADIRQLCVDNELLMFVHAADFDTVVVAILEIVRTALSRWGRPAAAAPAPGENLPSNYIDREHTGQDRELLEAFYRACAAEGGTADEIHLRGIKAVLAARPAIPATPPAPEPPAEALAARLLIEQVAAMADCIGANTVGQVTAISNRAAAWLRENPPGQSVTIEPRGCPTPGACSCVEPTPPAPEPGDVQKHVTHDHELKVWGSFFEALLDGTKNFEVRHNDRDFKPGDYLLLREWVENEYTGRELIKCVTYVLKGGIFGVEAGYVVLALAAKQTNAMQRLLSAPMDARGYLDLCTPTPPAPAPESVALNGYLQGYEAGRRDAAADAQQAAEAAQDPPAPESEEMQGLVIDLTEVSLVLDTMNKPRLAAALNRAATLLQQQSAELAPLRGVPVAVSERPPKEEDCNAEGRCWCYTPPVDVEGVLIMNGRWILSRPDWLDTHWLPYSALPLPAPQTGEAQP